MSEPSFPKHPARAPEAASAGPAEAKNEAKNEANIEAAPDAVMPEGIIDIVVNGEPRQVAAGITVTGLLAALGLADRRVAVERNREVVPRAEHARTVLAAGDTIELVTFVGGG